jgi:cytochrome c peroxidase
VEAQAGGPVLNPVEMNIPSEEYLVKRLSTDKKYQQLFTEAFPNEEKPLTFKNITYAIAAFERELITPSRFDNYLKGDENALSSEEKKGLKTYMDVGCTTCHAGALLGGNMYQKFGLFGDYWEYTDSKEIDEGRMMVTKNEADKYLFKVPSLRNIDKTYPFFHDGSVEKLDEAVRIMAKVELNKDLSDKETKEIVTFLASLTGETPSIAK